MRIEITAREEEGTCAECGAPMKEGQFCLRLYGEYVCSQGCAETYRESYQGRDFGAAHDQALANVEGALKKRPENFIFLYDEGDFQITSCVMALPEFAHACIPILVELSMTEGDIAPPKD